MMRMFCDYPSLLCNISNHVFLHHFPRVKSDLKAPKNAEANVIAGLASVAHFIY